MARYSVIQGDCLEVMKGLKDNCIDAVVTDPPYGLSKEPDMAEVLRHWLNGDDYKHNGSGFMGKSWDSFVPGPSVWREVYRVLKPGGHVLSFFGTRTYDMGVVAMRLAGFEIRDQVDWLYGSGFPKSKNIGDGRGTALKPGHEPLVMARKPLIGTVAENVMEYGTGGLNIDGCRVGTGSDKGIWPITKRRHADVTWTVQPVETNTTQGRWPANVIHDGSEEVEAEFAVFGGSRSPATYKHNIPQGYGTSEIYGKGGLREQQNGFGDTSTTSRFFYAAKASKKERNDGLGGEKNNHPTVKPTNLMQYLCRLITPPNGVILDPFCGTGSTGRGAMLEGFRFLGIEMDADYALMAKMRIKAILERDEKNPEDALPEKERRVI
jgi:DNA modification methylase